MRRRPELMQLEMGMSTSRYFPASGTAGLARSLVSGNRRVPCPPPIITESTSLVLADCRPVCDIKSCVLTLLLKPSLTRTQERNRYIAISLSRPFQQRANVTVQSHRIAAQFRSRVLRIEHRLNF